MKHPIDQQLASNRFDRVDRDGSGGLDPGDLRYLSHLAEEQRASLAEILKKVDTNRTGQVSREELVDAVMADTVTIEELHEISPEEGEGWRHIRNSE